MLAHLKQWSRLIKRDTHALYLAARDPRVPWYAKALGIAVAAYALSPIDLIPDFIPGIGQLDDAAIAAVVLRGVVRSAGPEVVAEHWPGSSRTLNVVLRLAGYG